MVAAAASMLTLSSMMLHAQVTPTPEEVALRQRVEELERKLQLLEQRLEQQAQTAAPSGAGGAPPAPAKAPAPLTATPSPHEEAMQQQIDQLSKQVTSL